MSKILSIAGRESVPAVRVPRRYHECPACLFETSSPDLCPDSLAGLDMLVSHGQTFRPAEMQKPEEPVRMRDWKTVALCIVAVPLGLAVAFPVLTYVCECIHLWTGIPWP